MKPLKLIISLGTPAILSNNSFDGVLAKLYIQKLKNNGVFDGNYATPLPFLAQSDGIYHASHPIFVTNKVANHSIFGHFDTSLYLKYSIKPRTAPFDSARGAFKNKMETFELQYIKDVIVYLKGDVDAICDLLQYLRFIGKKSSNGFGQITRMVIEEIEQDLSIIGENGQLMRNVPCIDKYKNTPQTSKFYGRVSPPYWDKSRHVLALMHNPHKGVAQ